MNVARGLGFAPVCPYLYFSEKSLPWPKNNCGFGRAPLLCSPLRSPCARSLATEFHSIEKSRFNEIAGHRNCAKGRHAFYAES